MSIEVSLTIIAISFLLLVLIFLVAAIYLVRFLCTLKTTTQAMELKINPLVDEAKKIANLTSSTTEMIRNHVELTTPLFQSLGKVSGFMKSVSDGFNPEMKNNTMNFNFESKKEKINVSDWADWIAQSVMLVQKLRHK